MIFAIWLRMNLKESPVFEKVSEGEKSPALAPASENTLGAMFTSKSFWLATGLRLDKREFGAYSNLPCRIFSSDVII